MPAREWIDGVTPRHPVSVNRLDSVDLLRGLVMVIMALDHTRDFVGNVSIDALDLSKTNPALFLTRWITHYCAPVFIFLAGSGAFLSGQRKTTAELSRFLWTRGLWLVVLELTWIRVFWFWNTDYRWAVGQVFWAIGWSMVLLSLLVRLPAKAVGIIGVVIICTHNLFDGLPAATFGPLGVLWTILHERQIIWWSPGYAFFPQYPLLPWLGVMCGGYGFGTFLLLAEGERRKLFQRLGMGLIAAFVLLRASNVYGDPSKWTVQPDWLFTIFSFVRCTKYGPSLLFVLMTIGPTILLLGMLRDRLPTWSQFLVTFGRVPMFYYLLHVPLLHGMGILIAYWRHGRADWLMSNPAIAGIPSTPAPPDHGLSLPLVYLMWVFGVAILYPVCRWFADLKVRRRDAWLSYL